MFGKQLTATFILFMSAFVLIGATKAFGCANLITMSFFQLVACGVSILVLVFGDTDLKVLGILVVGFGGFLAMAGAAWAPRCPMMVLMLSPGVCLMLSGRSLAAEEGWGFGMS